MILRMLIITLIIVFSGSAYAETKEASAKSEATTDQAFSNRLKEEKKTSDMLYSFSAHKPFYILPFSYNTTPSKGSLSNLSKVDHLEVKFQFSFKFNIVDSFWHDHFQWSFAYTNLSFWQLYNSKNSAPFRETNHEPDMFIVYHPRGINAVNESEIYRLGIVHQSNGQDVPESRSWNRLYAQGIFNFEVFVAALKVWYRFEEKADSDPLSPDGDDNPDILKYMGNFELQLNKKLGSHTFTALVRNSLRSEHKGALELDWSFPINEKYRGLVQFFTGYGESLIDYNHASNRFGVGLIMADWL